MLFNRLCFFFFLSDLARQSAQPKWRIAAQKIAKCKTQKLNLSKLNNFTYHICKLSAQKIEAYTSKPLIKKILWPNVLVCLTVHLAALYGLYLALTTISWATLIWGMAINESLMHRCFKHIEFHFNELFIFV